jgi:hypothetical protein
MGLPALLLSSAVVLRGLAPTPTAHAVRVDKGPLIDGDLSDVVWLAGKPVTSFTQQYPDENSAPTVSTEVRIVYDQTAIYFSFRCTDPNPRAITARLTRRDDDIRSDAVVIDLDTAGDHTRAFHFEVSAAGVQRDAVRTGDNALSWSWDAVWKSAVHRTSDGWNAEIAIPFATLMYPSLQDPQWRLQLKRFVSRRSETDQWVYIPLKSQGEMLRYGILDGLSDLPTVHGVSLDPFVTARLRSQWSPPSVGGPKGIDATGSGGLDASVGLTPALALQVTVLPDFGQVEADPAVLNLTTFELHLDEKRQFFLANADLFQLSDPLGNALGDQLFYSRRIGASTPAPYVPAGGTIVETPDTTQIWTATKLTGHVGDNVSIAILDGVTAAEDAQVRLPGGQVADEGLSPLSNFFIGRLRAPLGNNVSGGVTFTSVNRAESPGSLGIEGECPNGLPPGPDGRCTHDEQGLAADVTWQPRDGQYAAYAMVFGSHITGGPTALLLDGTELGSGALGFGARVGVAKTSGNFTASALFQAMSPRLDLNDAGYQPQQDYRWEYGRIGWRWYDSGPFQIDSVALRVAETDSWKGLLLGRTASLGESATFKSQTAMNFAVGLNQQAFDIREAGDGTPVQRPAGWFASGQTNSNLTRPVVYGAWGNAHSTWRGFGYGGGVWMSARLMNRLEMSLAPSATWNAGDPRHVDTETTTGLPNTYLFGLQEAFTQSTTLRAALTFTPTLTLQGYAQLFFSAVRYDQLYQEQAHPDLTLDALTPEGGDPHTYDSRSAVLNVSVVFRWEYLPGSALYLVYTHSQDGGAVPMPTSADGSILPAKDFDLNAFQRGPTEDMFLAKLSYHWGT